MQGSREFSKNEIDTLRAYFIERYMKADSDGLKIVENSVRAYSDIITFLYIDFQCKTGFRISEILSIRWGDVIAEDGTILECITLGKEIMKGKKYARTIYLPKSLRGLLKEVHRIWPYIYNPPKPITRESYIFMCTGNKCTRMHRSTMHKRLQAIFRDLGLYNSGKISSHSFRKSCFNEFYEICDRDIVKTASLTGHRNLSTLQHYLSGRIDDDQKQKLLDR